MAFFVELEDFVPRLSIATPAIPIVFVDAFGFGDRNAGRLAFFDRFQLHFTDGEENAGNQAASRTTQIELLRHANNADAFLAPISERVDTVALIS